MLHRATGYSGSMNIPNQLQASRVEELLIGIMVKAAQTGGCLPESRRQGILALFQRHMRCEAKQLAAVQSLIREAADQIGRASCRERV